LLNKIGELNIVGHVHSVLNLVLFPIAVGSLLEAVLRNVLFASLSVQEFLCTPLSGFAVLHIDREEGLNVEHSQVRRHSHIYSILHREFQVVVGSSRAIFRVESRDVTGSFVNPVNSFPC